MENILLFVEEYTIPIIIGCAIMNIVIVVLLAINYALTSSLKDKYRKLVKGTSGKNIEGILMEHMENVESVKEELQSIYRKLDIIDNKISFCVQKVGIIRYNAFQDTGSDLSFSIALLDDNNDGIILTGIHGRAESISYAKPIKKGVSNYSLSVEELQALERAKCNLLDHTDVQGSRSKREVG
ncbi:DUF4446 family protein [Alkaliphilus hydrothermalis]|uniref:DUF4446 domain-containing protein n=1 Tax=Alkaliphilus hydrothermalis TaxID=1482730 RepID=A0ABS2NRK0_9FIRM|nr:DUF4446 family protein [Alkaliphilus hydrothermalis]MBM7615578.1 hypothetical protein [Alkaliphilus hydrothermalis]